MKAQSCILFLSLWVGIVLGVEDVRAQVVPDTTLSTAVAGGPNYTITGGTNAGNNLYHSFSEFSVPTGGSAFFDNALTVENIFARVTGGMASTIDGTLQTNGTANLFLLNPAGILFGPNASLNIGGSLTATTADSLLFPNDIQFSATDTTTEPLLTVSAPIGLQMGNNSGAITVQGTGHRLAGGRFAPTDRSGNPIGLSVGTGNSLSFIGNGVNLSGGVVGVNGGGHLEVGSVSNGQVRLNSTSTGWVGGYSGISQLNDIQMAQQSLLDASGSQGSIQLQGRNVSLTEGSFALIQNLGMQPSSGITVNATGILSLRGNSANGVFGSSIQSENLGAGPAGNINIAAAQLLLQQAGKVFSQTFSPGAGGGSINIKVSGDITVEGFVPANPGESSTIATTTFGPLSNSGNITIASENLRVLDGGAIGTATFSSGQASAIQINTTGLTEIAGFNPFAGLSSSVSSSTLGDGNANGMTINTSRLVVRDGALLGSTTQNAGASGIVTVNASEAVEVRGRGPALNQVSRIISAAEIVDPIIQALLKIPPIPSGNSGSISIQTPSLTVIDQGTVTVRNDGPGISGDLKINAGSTFLNNQGSITATAQSGEGGNIFLQGNALVLRHNSLVSATAGGTGNGGNITINMPVIAGFENSDIVANAFQGDGGNINITTQGIFGLKFRPQLTPENDITASSEFGVNGTVTINDFSLDPDSGLVKLPEGLTDSSDQVAQGCSASRENSFIATGRGGVPASPNEIISRDRTWSDTRDLSEFVGQAQGYEGQAQGHAPTEINTWRTNPNGQVELLAADPTSLNLSVYATCAAPARVSL